MKMSNNNNNNTVAPSITNYGNPLELPLGYRFKPKEHELVFDFLKRKIMGEPSLCPKLDALLPVIDINASHPSVTFDSLPVIDETTTEIRYCYTLLKNKSTKAGKNKKNLVRTVGLNLGTWKNERSDPVYRGKDIRGNPVKIGIKTMLTYKPEGQQVPMADGTAVTWGMQQFSYDNNEDSSSSSNDNKMVLCRIKRKIDRRHQPNNNNLNDPASGLMMKEHHGVTKSKRRRCMPVSSSDYPQEPQQEQVQQYYQPQEQEQQQFTLDQIGWNDLTTTTENPNNNNNNNNVDYDYHDELSKWDIPIIDGSCIVVYNLEEKEEEEEEEEKKDVLEFGGYEEENDNDLMIDISFDENDNVVSASYDHHNTPPPPPPGSNKEILLGDDYNMQVMEVAGGSQQDDEENINIQDRDLEDFMNTMLPTLSLDVRPKLTTAYEHIHHHIAQLIADDDTP